MIRGAVTLLSLGVLTGCSLLPEAGAESPETVMTDLRRFAEARNWEAYWSMWTDRGRGWLIGEAATALAWHAYAQPNFDSLSAAEKKSIEATNEFLVRYKLRKDLLEYREGESSEEMCVRIAKRMGNQGGKFCKELFEDLQFGAFPGNGNWSASPVTDGRWELKTGGDTPVEAVRKGTRWLLDGGSLK
jgi:hypothetical protein